MVSHKGFIICLGAEPGCSMRCISVMSIPRKNGLGSRDRINVPCGKCPACLANKRINWALRLSEELKVSKSSKFITLTYDEKNNVGDLSVRDVQLFLKSFRGLCEKVDGSIKQRYFLTGEYGSKGFRPHYHILMFNTPDVSEMELYEMVGKAWKKGGSYIGTVTDASIMYTAKYLLKGSVVRTGCTAPFSLMSRGGRNGKGIGYTYVERMQDWHHAKLDRGYVPKEDYKMTMPRYWKDKIYCENTKIKQNEEMLQKTDEAFNKKIKEMSSEKFFQEEMEIKKDSYRKLNKIVKKGKL